MLTRRAYETCFIHLVEKSYGMPFDPPSNGDDAVDRSSYGSPHEHYLGLILCRL